MSKSGDCVRKIELKCFVSWTSEKILWIPGTPRSHFENSCHSGLPQCIEVTQHRGKQKRSILSHC